MNPNSIYYIQKLNLIKHPKEGGYFRETYRSPKVFSMDFNEGYGSYGNVRSTCTIIYYLLDGHQISPFHKIKNDEIWSFYKGSSVNIFMITDDGDFLEIRLGDNLDKNEYLQYIIRGNTWFAAELNDKTSYSLMCCIVSPGFDYLDFELGKKNELLKKFPQHSILINKLSVE